MPLDPAAYLHHVQALDMAPSRKLDLICIVAGIMESFVDRAFGVSSEQILLGTNVQRSTLSGATTLESVTSIKPNFERAARGDAAEESDQ